MAADVSSLVRILNGYKEEQVRNESTNGKSKVLITRDLLGGCSKFRSTELDLDLQVPNGWEKRLDMKIFEHSFFSFFPFDEQTPVPSSTPILVRSADFRKPSIPLFLSGKVYLQRCNSPISSSSSSEQKRQHQNRTLPELQDLNFPPSSSSSNLLEESCLDLKLVPSNNYQSVCTLDKVKSALERAQKESGKKRSLSSPIRCSISSRSSSIREEEEQDEEERSSSGLLFAAGCPGCLLYVLISKRNPKCPRCDSIVPSPILKKPRIDLNISV
ncbi:hypothetical protein HHK36_004716 [Tetracentron sinense]|uniref:GIR1-like zinc ribbon domain-containing protein n=1 Tax=Tetracentron sinense TaxID=13715 RepID=A0A834ZP30_TETSI|nr:hypothetical protein HHK36_004716 [Tetracentron sinense]